MDIHRYAGMTFSREEWLSKIKNMCEDGERDLSMELMIWIALNNPGPYMLGPVAMDGECRTVTASTIATTVPLMYLTHVQNIKYPYMVSRCLDGRIKLRAGEFINNGAVG